MANVTPEQERDITDRVAKAEKFLKDHDLSLQAVVYSSCVGVDKQDHSVFGTAVIPYLQDLRFSRKSEVSPIQKDELDKKI